MSQQRGSQSQNHTIAVTHLYFPRPYCPGMVFSDHFQVHVLRLHPLQHGHWEMLDAVAPALVYWLLFLMLGKKDDVKIHRLPKNLR